MSAAPPTPSTSKAGSGLSVREMLVIGLAALAVGEMYQDHLLTWPLLNVDLHWFDWHFAPPLFAWADALLSDPLCQLVTALIRKLAPLEAKLAAKLPAIEHAVEQRVEGLFHHAPGHSPGPEACGGKQAPAAPLTPGPSPAGEGLPPVIPIVEPAAAGAQQRGA